MGSQTGPTWDISGTTWVPYGLQYMGSLWVLQMIWLRAHIGSDMGPIWDNMGWVPYVLPYMGPLWVLQMTLAWVPYGFRYGIHMEPIWDNMGPIRAVEDRGVSGPWGPAIL